MAKFKARPVIVDAVQWFPGVDVAGVRIVKKRGYAVTLSEKAVLEVPLGELPIAPGMWIVTTLEGDRQALAPDAFERTYEEVK